MFFICITGCKNLAEGEILKNLFEKPYFRCSICMDVETIEMCGALKVIFFLFFSDRLITVQI
jgi:glycerol-3-phosphate dehydrogenase (NAD+)